MFSHKINEDIELKILVLRDAGELFKLVDKNREYLREWLPWVDSTQNPDNVKEFIQKSLKEFAEDNRFAAGIHYKGEFAGIIGFHAINHAHKLTAIGYWLGEEFQGKGIMTRVCKAVVNHCFVDLKLNRVEIRCAIENRKSRAIPERLKFRNEGTLMQCEWLYDHFVDQVVYGMLAEEWNQSVEV